MERSGTLAVHGPPFLWGRMCLALWNTCVKNIIVESCSVQNIVETNNSVVSPMMSMDRIIVAFRTAARMSRARK